VVVEGSDGQYAGVIQSILERRVERVPLLGGRISIEAINEGLERLGLLPRDAAEAGEAAPAPAG
jgi:hypothetical protein